MNPLAALESRLVNDWRQASRWWSVRINALGAILLPLLTLVPSMPGEIQALFPAPVRAILAAAWCVAAIIARMTAQKKHNG